jgi:hypothetical protein
MIRSAMFCLALCLPAAALADCPTADAPITKASYNSGATVEVIGRDGDRIVYRQTIAETGQVVEMTVQAGIYTLTALRDGEGAVFDWKAALPVVADLAPGASFHSEATLTTPGFMPPRPFMADVQVIGEEEVTVAGCTLTTLKVVVKNNEAGQQLGDNTKWIHIPSLLTVKSEIADHGEVRLQEVTAFD